MGGLLVHLLGVVPGPGEVAVFRGLKLTAQVTEERRVRELVVEPVHARRQPFNWLNLATSIEAKVSRIR